MLSSPTAVQVLSSVQEIAVTKNVAGMVWGLQVTPALLVRMMGLWGPPAVHVLESVHETTSISSLVATRSTRAQSVPSVVRRRLPSLPAAKQLFGPAHAMAVESTSGVKPLGCWLHVEPPSKVCTIWPLPTAVHAFTPEQKMAVSSCEVQVLNAQVVPPSVV